MGKPHIDNTASAGKALKKVKGKKKKKEKEEKQKGEARSDSG